MDATSCCANETEGSNRDRYRPEADRWQARQARKALAPSVGEQLELAAETYGQALSEGLNEDAIKSLYEELPKLTDLMLAQIPQGISPSTYCVFVALLLDQENTYNYLRLDDLPGLRVFLSRARLPAGALQDHPAGRGAASGAWREGHRYVCPRQGLRHDEHGAARADYL